MKLRYIIPTMIAVLAMLVGCSDDFEPTYLDGLKVSQSYVSLPADGGSVQLTVNADEAWTMTEIPEWLTVDPAEGGAGESVVTLTVAASTKTQKCTLVLKAGGMTQEINIIQYAAETDPVILTVNEALAMLKAGTQPETPVYVKGTVCKIQEISTQYGNATYYLSDDGTYGADNWLEVYRGYWINNEKFTQGDEFSMGDILVIKGVIMMFNGSVPETKQGTCEVISIEKSLLSVASVDIPEDGLPLEGGDFKVTLDSKGEGLTIDIPEEAKSWLSIVGISTSGTQAVVSFRAAANTGGERSATITFSTKADGVNYTAQVDVKQKGAIVAATVAEFLAAAVGDSQYRITGIIKSLYASDKQGKSFYIADYSGEVLIYRAEGFLEAGAKVGDVVTVVGKRGAYNDSPQMTASTFEELKYAVTAVTIDEFLTKEDADDVYYMVTGVVDEIANPTYGKLYLKSGKTRLYVYGCYPGWGASGDDLKGCIDNKGIEVGDELTVIGVKGTHNDATQLKNGIYFSHAAVAGE